MAARIRPVSVDQEQPEQSFVEAAQNVLGRALSEGATVLLIAWEDPKGKVTAVSVPGAGVLVRGMVDTLWDQVHPEMRDAE